MIARCPHCKSRNYHMKILGATSEPYQCDDCLKHFSYPDYDEYQQTGGTIEDQRITDLERRVVELEKLLHVQEDENH